MTTFLPAKTFTGYPDGNHKNPVRFVAGVESVEVPEEFAQLVRDKGLAASELEARLLKAPRQASRIDPPKAATVRKITAAMKPRRSGRSSRQSSSQD